ncbi:MAG TPA: flagellar basal body P-ring formation chaperone FlgA [Pirellulales bacterium]
MRDSRIIIAAVTACIAVQGALNVEAAELRLRSDARAQGAMVHLADVVDILGAEPGEVQSLGQIELMPAPAVGKQHPISVREIQDTLERRGVNMLLCHFTGASQVLVTGASDGSIKTKSKASIPNSSMQEAQRAVAAAITQYLQRCTGSEKPLNIDLDLTDAQAQAVLADIHHLAVRGGQSPWTGSQKFEIEIRSDIGPSLFGINVKISAPTTVVVTVRDVSKGSIITGDDVQLQQLPTGSDAESAFQSLDDVIGREAQLPIAPGQVLDPQYVRTPIMVKRGSVVTVFATAPGIKIRTTGRVHDDGGRGEQVTVESLIDRKTFLAKVTGIDQVEVEAETTTMPQEASSVQPVATSTSSYRKPLTKIHLATRPINTSSYNSTGNAGITTKPSNFTPNNPAPLNAAPSNSDPSYATLGTNQR